MTWMRAYALFALVALCCGGRVPPPERRVIETDLEDWSFRRYQRVVDVEVYVEGNPATAHTASYVRSSAERAGRIGETDVVNAFVTEYESARGLLVALVRFARRLAQEQGYSVEEDEVGGERVFLVRGHGEAWAFWQSGNFVVKVGGRGHEEVPSSVVKAYGKRYPSALTEGALDGPIEDLPSEEPK